MPTTMGAAGAAPDRPVLIHPGFHKTGTTFLQNIVFTDPRLFRPVWSHGEIDRFVIRPHDLSFDPQPGRDDIAERRKDAQPNVIDIVSSETLCGQPFTGSREAVMQARRVKGIFGEAKILFTVRRQIPMIRSIYIQYLKMGGTLGPEQFFDRKPPYGYYAFDRTVFLLDRLVEYYAELYGPDNVLVLTQEYLQKDLTGFIQTIRAFNGVVAEPVAIDPGDRRAHGVSPPDSGIPLLRLANHFWRSAANPEAPVQITLLARALRSAAHRQTWFFGGQKAYLDRVIRERFAGMFAQSNARLQCFSPCDLRAQGYEMPPAEAPPQ